MTLCNTRLARRLAVLAAAAVSTCVGSTQARPQWSLSGQAGFSFDGSEGAVFQHFRFDGGLRLEALLGRTGPKSVGIGPYLEARTSAFVRADYGGGVMALLPVDSTFPIWVGTGAFARVDGALGYGFDMFAAWGSRSYNHHSSYAMAYGLMLDVRLARRPEPALDVILALTIDLEALALPFVFLGSAIFH